MKSAKRKRPARSGGKAGRNGRAAADAELARLFEGIAGPAAPAPEPDAPADEAGKAAALAALADGSLLAPGAGNLERLGRAVSAGWLDDAGLVSDSMRRKIIDHAAARLREGGPAEKIAAAGVWDAIIARPNVRAVPPGAAPSTSGVGDAEPVPGGGGPAPSDSESDGAAPGGPPPGGRTKDGKFCRGNKISLGNAGARRQSALRGALLKTLDDDKLQALGESLYRRAIDGDIEAVKVLLGYALGKPGPAPDPDRLDAHEYAVLTGGPSLTQLWFGANETVDAGLAAAIWRKLSASDPDAATTQLLNAVESEPGRFAKDLDRVRARAAAAGR
jgi:hypothetical protein